MKRKTKEKIALEKNERLGEGEGEIGREIGREREREHTQEHFSDFIEVNLSSF